MFEGNLVCNTQASEPAEARLGPSGQPYRDLFPISITQSFTVQKRRYILTSRVFGFLLH